MILAHLRRRRGRALALLIGILVASTGFTVLTSDATASRLKVTASVQANARAAYDILVRPAGSRDRVEVGQSLVAPDFLSGRYGGITLAQWHAVQSVGGIDVAAPVAMVGYTNVYAYFDVDLTNLVDPGKQTQVIRVDRTWYADRRLTAVPDPAPQYVYVTRRPVVFGSVVSGNEVQWSDGRRHPLTNRCNSNADDVIGAASNPIEIEPDGSERVLCQPASEAPTKPHANLIVVHMLADGTFQGQDDEEPLSQLTIGFDWPMSMLLAAVDPTAEARLVGLDKAVTSGHYLAPTAPPLTRDQDRTVRSIPVLATDAPELDEQLRVRAATLAVPAGADIATPGWLRDTPTLPPVLATATATPAMDTTYQLTDEYRQLVSQAITAGSVGTVSLFGGGVTFAQAGPVTFGTGPGGALRPAPAQQLGTLNPQEISMGNTGTIAPVFFDDTSFRQVDPVGPFDDPDGPEVQIDAVGTFDPARLTEFSPLSAVSLETYHAPALTAADAASKAALGAQPLRADSNVAGYVASPPTLLTSLAALDFMKLRAPISAIRVRVAGVTGVDPVSRERVRVAAQRIQAATGLDVDITVGSSPSPQTIDLAAGKFGRPALVLSENWTRKGVALAVIRALDRKSLVLFVLILVVCVLFLGNAVTATVRDRRRELATLACLGWPRSRLVLTIATEVLLVGLVAGAVSAAAALPVARAAGVPLGGTHALLAVPLAVGLAGLAAAVPAWRGSHVTGAAALSGTAAGPRRGWRPWRRRRTVGGMAVSNLLRNPGRTLLGALALGIGIAAVTVLVAITAAFHGSVTGSLLGDAVSLQVRGVDAGSVAATVALGLIAVADIVYLGIRERAAEFAALRATGWTDATLTRLVALEGLGIGLLGAVLGAAAGTAAIATFGGTFDPTLGWAAAATAAGGIVLAAVASLVPARMQRRLPMSTLLAEE